MHGASGGTLTNLVPMSTGAVQSCQIADLMPTVFAQVLLLRREASQQLSEASAKLDLQKAELDKYASALS